METTYKLLTQKDVAERWQMSVRSVEDLRKKGVLVPVKNVPGIRFSPEHVRALEGVELDRFSPFERKRMEKQIAELELENERLKGILGKTLSVLAPVINL